MLGMRWSPHPSPCPLLHYFLLGLYNEYGIYQLPLPYKHYGFIQTLFTFNHLTNIILNLKATPFQRE